MPNAVVNWKHSKFKARNYMGRYVYPKRKPRKFKLSALLRTGKVHNVSFPSHFAAADAGWKRVTRRRVNA